MGRNPGGQRYGPRPLDLDIIFYDECEFSDQDLTIPHARWHERAFVQAPLDDLFSPDELQRDARGVKARLLTAHRLWQQQGGE